MSKKSEADRAYTEVAEMIRDLNDGNMIELRGIARSMMKGKWSTPEAANVNMSGTALQALITKAVQEAMKNTQPFLASGAADVGSDGGDNDRSVGSPVKEREKWNTYARSLGVPKDWLGKKFKRKNTLFTIVGLNPRATKNVLRIQTQNGKVYVAPVTFCLSFMGGTK